VICCPDRLSRCPDRLSRCPAYPLTRLLAIFHTHADAFRIVASQPPTIGSWRLARAPGRANREPSHRAPVLPATGSHGGDGVSGGVHPLRRLHRCLSRARAPEGSGRRSPGRGHTVSRAGVHSVYRLSHHAMRSRVSYTGSDRARAGVVGLSAWGAGAPARALRHLPRERMPAVRRCLSHGRGRPDDRQCRSSRPST
jgi:hypothetical protein